MMLIGISILLSIIYESSSSLVPESKIIDLTHPFDKTTLGYPKLEKFKLTVLENGTTDAGYWLQIEKYGACVHVGTHIDAPCHIRRGMWTLDQIPLERFMAPAAVVDITHRTRKDRDANLEVEDLRRWERVNRRKLHCTIVLVNTGWGQKWSNPREFLGMTNNDVTKIHFPGVSPEAAQWLADNRNIYGVGIDTTSLDSGQAVQRKAHEALFGANIYGMENVANIDKLPPYGAKLHVSPMKITGASGAPTRIFAVLP